MSKIYNLDPFKNICINKAHKIGLTLDNVSLLEILNSFHCIEGTPYAITSIDSILEIWFAVFKSKSTLSRNFATLECRKYIVEQDANIIKQLIERNKTYEYGPHMNCEWCGKQSIVLDEHHYPIPSSKGGVDTVRICPNCHYTYHRTKLYKLQIESLLKDGGVNHE